jgi:hypothetical protein
MVHEKVIRHFKFKGNTLDIESEYDPELELTRHTVTIVNSKQIRKEVAHSKESIQRLIENHLSVTGDYLVKTGFTKSITIMKNPEEAVHDYSKIW